MKKKKKIVFFIDNDRDLVETLSRWFSKRGYDARISINDLTSLPADSKTVLMLDFNIGDVKGPELVPYARKLAGYSRVYLIPAVMTDQPGPHQLDYPVFDKSRGLRAMKHFIDKLANW